MANGSATALRTNVSQNGVKLNKAFIAAPMSGMNSNSAYEESRRVVLSLVGHLCEHFGLRYEDVYYAGKSVSSQQDFNDVSLALEADLKALDEADVFLLYYPVKVASSVLVEAGYALARNKPMILLPKDAKDLPYFFKQASDASCEGKIPSVKIYEYHDDKDILEKVDMAIHDFFQSSDPCLAQDS